MRETGRGFAVRAEQKSEKMSQHSEERMAWRPRDADIEPLLHAAPAAAGLGDARARGRAEREALGANRLPRAQHVERVRDEHARDAPRPATPECLHATCRAAVLQGLSTLHRRTQQGETVCSPRNKFLLVAHHHLFLVFAYPIISSSRLTGVTAFVIMTRFSFCSFLPKISFADPTGVTPLRLVNSNMGNLPIKSKSTCAEVDVVFCADKPCEADASQLAEVQTSVRCGSQGLNQGLNLVTRRGERITPSVQRSINRLLHAHLYRRARPTSTRSAPSGLTSLSRCCSISSSPLTRQCSRFVIRKVMLSRLHVVNSGIKAR